MTIEERACITLQLGYLCTHRWPIHVSIINHCRNHYPMLPRPCNRPLTIDVHRLRVGVELLPLVRGVRDDGSDGRKCRSGDEWVHEEGIAAGCASRGCASDLWHEKRTTGARI